MPQSRLGPHLRVPGVIGLIPLASGSGCTFYRGTQPSAEREVTVKVLHDELTSLSGQRFDRERTIVSRLSGHAGVVPLFETGIIEGDELYHVTPYYERGSLDLFIHAHGPLGWRQATYLVESVAITLAEIQGSNIVHRNVQPGAIVLTDFLMPRVGELERALPTGETPSVNEPTPAPFFQAAEAPPMASADPTEDVYGLGAVLWALLAGQSQFAPIREPGADGLDALTATILARLGHLPAAVEPPPDPILDLVAQSMSAVVGRRPANAAAFVTELRCCVAEAQAEEPDETNTGPAVAPAPRPLTPASPADPVVPVVPLVPEDDPTLELTREDLIQHGLLDHLPNTHRDTGQGAAPRRVGAAAAVLLLVACITGLVVTMMTAAITTAS